jgi:hypothetical protein
MTHAQRREELSEARAVQAQGDLAFQALERGLSRTHRVRKLCAWPLELKSLSHHADPVSMRWLTPSLVALALVFSAGGVAIVGRADSNSNRTPDTQQSVAPAEKTPPTPQQPDQCAAPSMARRAPIPARTVPRAVTENKSIVLNTNGYNYPIEGQWHPNPVGRPHGVPDGVLPKDLEAAPAVPEAK